MDANQKPIYQEFWHDISKKDTPSDFQVYEVKFGVSVLDATKDTPPKEAQWVATDHVLARNIIDAVNLATEIVMQNWDSRYFIVSILSVIAMGIAIELTEYHIK